MGLQNAVSKVMSTHPALKKFNSSVNYGQRKLNNNLRSKNPEYSKYTDALSCSMYRKESNVSFRKSSQQ